MGQPGCGRRLPQPAQLTIGDDLLGYHNNNNNKTLACLTCSPVQVFLAQISCTY